MTVTTIFASTFGGYIESSSGTYALARDGSSLAIETSPDILRVGQFIFGVYLVDQSFISFDTSSIPLTDAVSSIVLDMFWEDDFTAANFTCRALDYLMGDTFTASDWRTGAQLQTLQDDGHHVASQAAGTGVIDTYVTFTSLAPFLTISNLKSASTLVQLILTTANQFGSGTAPVGNEWLNYSSPDVAGTTEDPKLTITHATTQSRIPYASRPLRVWHSRS